MLTTNNNNARYYAALQGKLVAGKVDNQHFELLVDLVGVKSERMESALRAVLVHGKSRKLACEEYCVSQSYLSIKIGQFQRISALISNAYVYYPRTDKI